MSFRGKFDWYISMQKGGRKAVTFTLTCKNMLMPEIFDCAIMDPAGQQATQFHHHLKLRANQSKEFNLETCGWEWCQGDKFCILDKKGRESQSWVMNMKVYGRGECPDCHGSHKCVNCHGNGIVEDRMNHTINVCPVCKGSGICQKCYVPVRLGSALAQEVYGSSPLPNAAQNRDRKVATLQQTINNLVAKIEKADMDIRMMQLKGFDVSASTAYRAQVEMKFQLQHQLENAQHELQQLININNY